MKKWEYKITAAGITNYGYTLDEYGDLGWELVSVIAYSDSVTLEMIFKRPKEPTNG